jgi:hypothetical protein
MGFTIFWMNLDIFTMVKLVNPPMNKDWLLWTVNKSISISEIQIYQVISLAN